MSLPPIPYGDDDPVAEDMREYGALCRKEALEEAVKVCAAVCSERDSAFANGYNQGALDCEKKIKELL